MPVFLIPIAQWMWANKKILLEIGACLIIAVALWWFCIHNPAVIKKQEAQISALKGEVEAAHSAINLLTSIEVRHSEIDQNSNNNQTSIRVARKPARTGYFILPGVLPAVYQTYSSAS